MVLFGVKENDGWLISRWNLTYAVGWEQICKAVYALYDEYINPEILIDGRVVEIKDKKKIVELPESGNMVIRGLSNIFKVPVMITFYNQLQAVDLNIASIHEEFKVADYQKFTVSMGQFMDSIELSMYWK